MYQRVKGTIGKINNGVELIWNLNRCMKNLQIDAINMQYSVGSPLDVTRKETNLQKVYSIIKFSLYEAIYVPSYYMKQSCLGWLLWKHSADNIVFGHSAAGLNVLAPLSAPRAAGQKI